jgi:hypothetical protein
VGCRGQVCSCLICIGIFILFTLVSVFLSLVQHSFHREWKESGILSCLLEAMELFTSSHLS